jgi:hypothetical protein
MARNMVILAGHGERTVTSRYTTSFYFLPSGLLRNSCAGMRAFFFFLVKMLQIRY